MFGSNLHGAAETNPPIVAAARRCVNEHTPPGVSRPRAGPAHASQRAQQPDTVRVLDAPQREPLRGRGRTRRAAVARRERLGDPAGLATPGPDLDQRAHDRRAPSSAGTRCPRPAPRGTARPDAPPRQISIESTRRTVRLPSADSVTQNDRKSCSPTRYRRAVAHRLDVERALAPTTRPARGTAAAPSPSTIR